MGFHEKVDHYIYVSRSQSIHIVDNIMNYSFLILGPIHIESILRASYNQFQCRQTHPQDQVQLV